MSSHVSLVRQPLLAGILVASAVSTAVHYTDNYVFMEAYPQPPWVTRLGIVAGWIVLTSVGALGYWLYRQGHRNLAYACLLVYSVTGLSTLGHYVYGGCSAFSTKTHVLIVTDGLTGLAVVGFVVWSAHGAPLPSTKPRSCASSSP